MIAGVVDVNVAVTKLKLLMLFTRGVIEQVGVGPGHAVRVHPVKMLPAAGVAVSVTGAKRNLAVQAVPQLMPAGLDVIVPDPLPAFITTTVGGRLTVTENAGGVPLTLTRLPPSDDWTKSVMVPKFAPPVPAVIVSVVDVVPSATNAGLKVPVTS